MKVILDDLVGVRSSVGKISRDLRGLKNERSSVSSDSDSRLKQLKRKKTHKVRPSFLELSRSLVKIAERSRVKPVWLLRKESVVVDRLAVESRWSSGLEPSEGEVKLPERLRQASS
jgi:hypothetical protein